MLQNSEKKPLPGAVLSRVFGLLPGLVSGLLCWFVLRELGIIDLFPWWRKSLATIFAAGALGMVLELTRARKLLLPLVIACISAWLVVAFTSLAAFCARPLIVSQPPVKADAVVVLLAAIQLDNDFGTPSLERTLRGLELLQSGFAPRLIVTQSLPSKGSNRIATSRLMRSLKIARPLDVVEPVHDTHDEAVQVSRLCRERGWKKVLLVTSPVHSRRAALVFAKTGLEVVSTPCQETSYDLENLTLPTARLAAFNGAIHEIIGLRIYRARGWI